MQRVFRCLLLSCYAVRSKIPWKTAMRSVRRSRENCECRWQGLIPVLALDFLSIEERLCTINLSTQAA